MCKFLHCNAVYIIIYRCNYVEYFINIGIKLVNLQIMVSQNVIWNTALHTQNCSPAKLPSQGMTYHSFRNGPRISDYEHTPS